VKSQKLIYFNPIWLSIDSNIKFTYSTSNIVESNIDISFLWFKQSFWYSHIFLRLVFSEELCWCLLVKSFAFCGLWKSCRVFDQLLHIFIFWEKFVKYFGRLSEWAIGVVWTIWFGRLLSFVLKIDTLGLIF
jgi:hypothetical protein